MDWAILCLIPSLTAFQSNLIEQKAYKRLGSVKQEAQFLMLKGMRMCKMWQ